MYQNKEYYAVINGLGFTTCVTDSGKSAHHIALWDNLEQAKVHAELMLDIQSAKIHLLGSLSPTTFNIVKVKVSVVDD